MDLLEPLLDGFSSIYEGDNVAMKHVHVGNSKFAVQTGGHKGYPLLLVHGFPLDHTIWQPQIDFFTDHCKVIAPDLRGFGGSDITPGNVSMEQMADDLHGLLAALEVHEKLIYCGLSMGGYVGWQFWKKYRHKVLAMILCDTRAVPDSPDAAAGRHRLAAGVLEGGPTVASAVMMPKMFAPATQQSKPDLVQFVQQMMDRQQPAGIAAALEGMAVREDARPLLETIDVPTLVVVGEHDAISTVDEMRHIADAIPDAGWVMVPGAGHLANLENPQVVNEAIAEFITL
jgi:3-oxoadipate enol-lactonase